MENFPSLPKYILIGIFLCFGPLAIAQDFKVQHIQDDVDNSASTTSTIAAVSSLANAFAIPGNNKMTHAGRSNSDEGNLEGDDMAGARVLTATNTLTYYRETGSRSQDMNFQTMIWEYTGTASGANEFIVRGRYAIVLNGGISGVTTDITFPANTNSLSSVSSANKCIPFITGIMNDASGNQADSGTAIAYLADATTLEVKKGTNENNVTVYVTLVEFTGSNWTVLHGTSGGNNASTGTIMLKDDSTGTGTTTAVGNWNDAIIFTQSKAQTQPAGGSKQRINAQWPIMEPGANTQSVNWTFDSGRNSTNNKSNHFVHVLENTEIEVTRYTDTSSANDESTINIMSASLTALDKAMIIGTSITSGNQTTYGRGWRNYYLNSITEAAHWSHRSGNTMSHNIQIVNFDPPLVQSEGPGGITTNLELWLKANAGAEEATSDAAEDTDPVLNWLDNSINANNATQATGTNKPIFTENAINFNPAIDFDGTNHEMIAAAAANDEITIFAVAEGTYSATKNLLNLDNGANGFVNIEQTTATTLQGLYNDGSADSGIVTNGTTAIAGGTPFLVNYRHLAISTNSLFINGIVQGVVSANADNLSGTLTAGIGANPSTSSTRWNGGIAEMIIYNYKVPEAERFKIESYLAIKYGITIGVNGTSQDYVDSDARVIWDITTNSGYNYNVTGIGKDNVSELEQKQSKTINTTDDITVGIKEIAATNSTNTRNFFADKTFLMWGHDNGATTATTDISKDFGAGTGKTTNLSVTPITRKWKMVVTDSVPTIKLSIPKTMVSSTYSAGEKYVMIVADDAAFTTNITSATMDDVGADLEVDFYFEGTKFITFGSTPEESIGSNSAYFDNYGATDTYLDAGDVNDLDNTDFTISAWVKRDTGENKFDVVSKRNYFNEGSVSNPDGVYTEGYAFRVNKSGHFRMVWKEPSDTGNYQLQTNETIPENEWHHIAATYDISANMAILYIDGIHVYDSDDFLADKGYAIDPLNSPNDSHFIIGAAHHIKRQQKIRGSIDEVRVWNVPLSGDQIRYIMNQEIEENASLNADGKVLPSTTTKNDIESIPWNNLIAYYPMSTAVFGSIKDGSNSGNDASMINYNNIDEQTAPLPYASTQNGAWDDPNTWENGDVQYLPGVVSYLYENEALDTDKITMDYNIVQINNDVTMGNSDTNLIPAYKNGNRTVLGLDINSSGDLQLDGVTASNTGYAITVSHYLKLDGTIDLEGESQLIQTTDSDLDPTSSGSLERDQQGNSNAFLYNYWCSPVGATNETTNNNDYRLSDVFSNIGYNTAGYNGTTSPLEIADYWIWKYADLTGNQYSLWQHVRSTGNLKTGEGFTMKGVDVTASINDDQNYIFSGKPNNGDFTLHLDPGNEYLVGNPYPSAIDADEFIKDNISNLETNGRNTNGNVINGALYFWDHFAVNSHLLKDYQGGYATYTLMGGVFAISNDARINASNVNGTKVPERYIPVGQGFFVSSIDDTDLDGDSNDPVMTQPIVGGDILFKNSQRVFKKENISVSNTGSIFLKNGSKNKSSATKTSNDTKQRIRLMFDSPDGYHRQILVGADEDATNNFDIGYDALIAESNKEDMYWLFNNAKFIIQAVNNFNIDQILPLGIKTNKEGLASIKIDYLENIDSSLDIFVHDKELNTYHNLKSEVYEVSLPKGEFLDRFEITFSSSQSQISLGVDDIENNEMRVYFSNEKESVVIQNPTLKNINTIEMFNILGQSIYNFNKKTNESYIEYKTKQIRTGAYIIKIKTDEGISSKKVLIN